MRGGDPGEDPHHRRQVIRTASAAAGGCAPISTRRSFPPGTDVYARRDVDKLARMAAAGGEAIGILRRPHPDTPLPWTRMRATTR